MTPNRSLILQTWGKIAFVCTPVVISIALGVSIGANLVRSSDFDAEHLALLPFFAFGLMSFATFGTSFLLGLIVPSVSESTEEPANDSSRMLEVIETRAKLKRTRQNARFEAELQTRERELELEREIERQSRNIRTENVLSELDVERKVSQERHELKLQELEQRRQLLDLEAEILKREALVAQQREELQHRELGPGREPEQT